MFMQMKRRRPLPNPCPCEGTCLCHSYPKESFLKILGAVILLMLFFGTLAFSAHILIEQSLPLIINKCPN